MDLSRRYGILTPYTAFLADERGESLAIREQLRRADVQLGRLNEVQGAAGVGQREVKARLSQAQAPMSADAFRLPAEAEMAAANRPSSGRGELGGMMGGMGPAAKRAGATGGEAANLDSIGVATSVPGMGYAAAPARGARVAVGQDAEGRAYVAGNVRRMGGKTFYKRGERWVDSALTPELEKKAETIEQFSDAYFELAREQTAEQNQFLTFEEPVTVVLGGKAYKIERPEGR